MSSLALSLSSSASGYEAGSESASYAPACEPSYVPICNFTGDKMVLSSSLAPKELDVENHIETHPEGGRTAIAAPGSAGFDSTLFDDTDGFVFYKEKPLPPALSFPNGVGDKELSAFLMSTPMSKLFACLKSSMEDVAVPVVTCSKERGETVTDVAGDADVSGFGVMIGSPGSSNLSIAAFSIMDLSPRYDSMGDARIRTTSYPPGSGVTHVWISFSLLRLDQAQYEAMYRGFRFGVEEKPDALKMEHLWNFQWVRHGEDSEYGEEYVFTAVLMVPATNPSIAPVLDSMSIPYI